MKKAIQYILLIGCLLLIGSYFYRHQHELEILGHLTLINIVALNLMFILLNLILIIKLFIMLQGFQIRGLKFLHWSRIFVISRFVSFYLSQGANVYRSVKLKQSYDFPYTRSLGMIMFLAWLEFIIFLIIALIFMFLHGRTSPEAEGWMIPALGATLFLLIIGPFLAHAMLHLIKTTNAKLTWVTDKLKELTTTILLQIKNVPLMIVFCLLSVLTFVMTVWIIHYSFESLHIAVGLVSAFLYTLILLASRNVNIVPGNIGLTELLCGYFTDSLGYTVGSGIIVSSLFRVIDFISTALLALAVSFIKKPEPSP